MREVVITGLGIISPIGQSAAEVTEHLLTVRSGIRLWSAAGHKKTFPAGLVEGEFDSAFERKDLPYLDRLTKLGVAAADQALADAGLPSNCADLELRVGVFAGTVNGGINSVCQWLRDYYADGKQTSRPFTLMAGMPNAPAAWISLRHQIAGPVITHTTACASSGVAIGDAMRWIRHGDLDVAIAGGCEAALTPPVMGAWDGLRALAQPDPDDVGRSCRPFSRDRSGLVLAEGAVFFVLESADHALARGARVYATLSGYGIACDAYHIGAPHSRGQTAAITAALHDAGLRPADLSYINAHGTATPTGDPVEVSSIRSALGNAVDDVPVSSTKAQHGHMLGAASAMELAVCVLAMKHGFLPATAFLEDIDPACQLRHVPNVAEQGVQIHHTLSLSAGFGGTNAALVASRRID
jgi:3-oxoacyl-[acyl-carrier-protein] synthase II